MIMKHFSLKSVSVMLTFIGKDINSNNFAHYFEISMPDKFKKNKSDAIIFIKKRLKLYNLSILSNLTL
jgi:hypothetical protein